MVFMKQFGVKRSGTNYIRALLMRNFDVTVLVNILGWKHGLYEPPMSWLAQHRVSSEALKVQTSREGRETLVVKPFNVASLEDAVRADRVVYVISARHPYAIAYSQWRREQLKPGQVEQFCADFRMLYSDWMSISRPHFVVRHEDLLRNWSGELEKIERDFGVTALTGVQSSSKVRVGRIVHPSDDDCLIVSECDFFPDKYLTGAYLNEMPKWLYSELERLIDWSWASEMLQYASDGSF